MNFRRFILEGLLAGAMIWGGSHLLTGEETPELLTAGLVLVVAGAVLGMSALTRLPP